MILDCTLRDGGYYVNWDFDPDTVRKYLTAVATAKIEIIEIGFRFLPAKKFLGASAYSTDVYLKSIDLPGNVLISVMVNASEIINCSEGIDNTVNQLFTSKSESPVDIVRIATNIDDIEQCHEIVERLNVLGYRVFLNLMQIDLVSHDKLVKTSSLIESWNMVEVLYMADSFGSLDPVNVKKIIKTIENGWSGPLGIHAHDNKGLAVQNTMAALNAGVLYLDSTICGMGRGAGNARTEYLLVELGQRKDVTYFPDAVFPLALQEFNALQKIHQWGPNMYYYLSALHGIHPTYIQEMLGDERYGTDQILSSINFLKSSKEPFFSFENMLRASSGIEGNEYGEWSAEGMFTGKTILILGSGASTKKYIDALQLFIKQNNIFVLCLNINKSVPESMVDAYVACHETRILIEFDYYTKLNKPIIIPLTRVPKVIREIIKNIEILDYGLRVESGCFEIKKNGCVLSSTLSLAYAISVATIGGADKILLAGVDGYSLTDKRQIEMVELFHKYTQLKPSIPISAITPTTVPVTQGSIFAPEK